MQVVGWFINSGLEGYVPTIHFKLNEFRSSHFVLVCGELESENKDVKLTAYVPLANKNFNTCFGVFGQQGLCVSNTNKNVAFFTEFVQGKQQKQDT